MSGAKFGNLSGMGAELSSDTVLPPQDRRRYPFLAPPQTPDELGRAGDYRVLRVLGIGGMGIVFEAEDPMLHRPVALKFLRPELAAEAGNRERFLREARAAAGISSDHVVSVYHVGVEGDVPYMATQLLPGESLQTRIDRSTQFDLASALTIARHIAAGLASAHALGLVHRDIKPANIWLESDGAGGAFRRAKLLDFGLARHTKDETSLTATGMIVGTPDFMSPEHANGLEIDHRADLFCLGAVLYTMLAGELPFKGNSAMAVMMAVTMRPAPRLLEKNPTVPAGVADLVERLMAKEPSERPQSATEAIAALDAALAKFSGERPPIPAPSDARSEADTVVPRASMTATNPRLRRPASPPKVRSQWPVQLVGGLLLFVLIVAIGFRVFRPGAPHPPLGGAEPIVVGVLHSQSGTMAVSERPVIDATLLAVEELNAAGGVLGRPIRVVLVDGKSKPDEFYRQAERLLVEEKADVLFGCWTSASRKAVGEVLRRHNDGLLFYPVQYEGLGDSPRIVYMGPAPNQQLIPAIDFLTRSVAEGGLGKKRLYIVGSDYVFPRVAREIILDQVKLRASAGVQIAGESFIPLGSDVVLPAVSDIKRTNADAIVNLINGGTNVEFFHTLREQKVFPADVPTLSVSITENEIQGLNPAALAGDYLAASYFESIDRHESREFIRKLRDRYKPTPIATDPMAAAYSGVHLWAKAVEKAGTTDPTAVREAVRGIEFEGVRTRVRIDPDNLHAWLPARFGKIRPDGHVDLVPLAGSETPLQPIPFPPTRKVEEWNQFLLSLQFKWDGKWQPPEK